MFENQNKEQVVEEVLDSVDTNEVEGNQRRQYAFYKTR